MHKVFFNIAIVLLCALMVFSFLAIVNTAVRNNAEKKDFESLALLTQTPPETTMGEAQDYGSNSIQTEQEPIFTRNLNPLYEKNSDCIGWICIPDTAVDYPVMHTPQNPQKYLRKNFDCEYSSSGVPFLHENNTLDSDNLIIYGHNMKNGTMFSDITRYRNDTYCAEHPTIELETRRGLKLYTVFAVVQVKNNNTWYQFITANDEEDYKNRIKMISEAALYTFGASPQYGQQLLTLSTCYGNSKNDRLIIIAAEYIKNIAENDDM